MSSTIQYILIICVYFAAMLGIGLFFSKRNNTKSDYFLAKDKLPPRRDRLLLFRHADER